MTLDDLIRTSLTLADRTKALYRDCVRSFTAFTRSDPTKYTPAMVEEWLYSLRGTERGGQTVNVYRKAIRFTSKRWAKHGLGPDFAADVEKVKTNKSPARSPLSYEEAGKLLETCAAGELVDLRDRAMLVLALRTGLRRDGMRALEFSGIQPPRITTRNKGGSSITFEADRETFAALEAWIAELRTRGITTGPVFRKLKRAPGTNRARERPLEIRTPLSAWQIWEIFNERSSRAGIRHVFPHLARHTTVTWLRESGKSSAEVSKLTGQTERTIEDIYTHVRTDGAIGDALPSLLKKGI